MWLILYIYSSIKKNQKRKKKKAMNGQSKVSQREIEDE